MFCFRIMMVDDQVLDGVPDLIELRHELTFSRAGGRSELIAKGEIISDEISCTTTASDMAFYSVGNSVPKAGDNERHAGGIVTIRETRHVSREISRRLIGAACLTALVRHGNLQSETDDDIWSALQR